MSGTLVNSSAARRFVKQGFDALCRENEDEAYDLLREALRHDPDDPRALYLTALCAHLLSREETIDRTCLRALKSGSRRPYALASEAVRYLYLSNFSRAESLFEQALRAQPDNLDLLVGTGILHEYSGDITKGIAAFRRVLELDPGNVRAHVSIGAFHAMEGDFEAAMGEYREAKLNEPSLENPHQKLGRDYFYDGMFEEATSEFALAAAEEPGEPAAYFYLLDCLRRLERADDALDTYAEIRRRFGGDPEITSGYYEHFNMRDEAIASLERLRRSHPADTGLLTRLARAYLAAERVEEAVGAAEQATRLARDHDALALLGGLYLKAGRYQAAIRTCRRAIELNANSQQAYKDLADALLFLGRQDESYRAIRDMERVRKQAWEEYQAKFSGQDRADAGV